MWLIALFLTAGITLAAIAIGLCLTAKRLSVPDDGDLPDLSRLPGESEAQHVDRMTAELSRSTDWMRR